MLAVIHLPGLPMKTSLLVLLPVLAMTTLTLTIPITAAAAQASDAGLQRCSMLADRDARLSCFDALAAAAASDPQVLRPMTAAAVPARLESFGLERPQSKEPEQIDSQIDGLFEGWGPNSVISLSNGQRWQVSDGSSAVLYLNQPKALVRRGAMGTFVLELEGSNQTAKVRRLR